MSFFNRSKYPAHIADEPTVGQQAALFAWEIFKVVVISLAIIIPVRYYLFKPFYVKGASMEPNFHDHQYLIIDEITYRFNLPQRGEAVVFNSPYEKGQYFIKRVIGLPGERVKVANGFVTIYNTEYPEGVFLDETYLPEGLLTNGDIEVQLNADEYYVLGDNRTASLDSRTFGPINRSVIVGRTFFRGWPLDKVGVVTNQIDYNL